MNKDIVLSIIMPTCDRGEVFEISKNAVLDAIQGFDVEYIVVNDSKNTSLALTNSELLQMQVFDNPKKGVASARNLGASKAKGDILIFLDDDVVIDSENIKAIFDVIDKIDMNTSCFNLDWVYPPQLVSKISKTPFGRFLISYDFTTMRGWSNDPNWKENAFFEVPSLASHCLIILKQNFNKINGYNEQFPHAGFEDDDFSKRIASFLKIYLSTNSVVWHNESDRVEPTSWLARKERGGHTRKVAVDLGREELKLQFSGFKTIAYSIIHVSQKQILFLLNRIPNHEKYDSIYSKGIKLLLGASIFKGYKSKK